MNIYQPYTYLVKFKLTGQVYYGVRTSKNCHPNDLWVTYFTSSAVVKELIKQHGTDAFEYEVRHIFKTKIAAYKWESAILKKFNAAQNENWLNKSNAYPLLFQAIPRTSADFTAEWKANISKSLKGKHTGVNNPNFGNKYSTETRTKISESRKAKSSDPTWNIRPPCSAEKAEKIKKANLGKRWIHNKSSNERKYINPADVAAFISDGWEYGIGPRS